MGQTSGSERHRATAMIAQEKRPSRPTSPINVWMFGVYRNGTVSLLIMVGTFGVKAKCQMMSIEGKYMVTFLCSRYFPWNARRRVFADNDC